MKIKVLLISLFCYSFIFSQTFDRTKIDHFINHIEDHNQGIGSISIFKNGSEVYNRSFGKKQIPKLKVDAHTKYQIGSITKLFTATLILQLIEKGQLRLDDKLSQFYPEIPNAYNITIKHLLEHSSGLGDFVKGETDPKWLVNKINEEKILKYIAVQGTTFEAGQKKQYSNSGYYLLARILEKKYKKSYRKILSKQLLKPLELTDITSYSRCEKNTFHSYEYWTSWTKMNELEFSNVVGVGDIAATTSAMNTFISNLFQYNILKQETVELMKPKADKNGKGLMQVPFYEKKFYGHGGTTLGTHSMLIHNAEDNISISYSINGHRFNDNDFLIGILSVVYNVKYNLPVFTKSLVLKSEDLEQYVGIYAAIDDPFIITIFKENNRLFAQGTDQPSFPLEAYKKHQFKFEEARLKIHFIPEEKKLVLYQDGDVINYLKN